MVCIFEKDETTFSGNGLAILDPIVCTVSEEAGGGYELHMEHPMDENGKFLLLQEEMIIRAPVPKRIIPDITLPEVKIWQTTEQADVYSVLPYYKKTEVDPIIQRIRQSPNDYAWKVTKAYNAGALVTYAGTIYKAAMYNFAVVPNTTAAVWNYVAKVNASSGGGTLIPGTVIETLPANETISKLADYNADYIRVRTLLGNIGYVERAKCAETAQTHSGEVIPGRTITTQLFRIYRVEGDDIEHSVTVDARHISYDYAGNKLMQCKIMDAEPITAIAILQGSLVNPDQRQIICNITGQTITKDWSFISPVNAMLDPENGMISLLGAAMIRDNQDFFILDNSNPRKGITIEYGVNMIGVKWNRNVDPVVTRIIPRANAGTDSYVFLDQLCVDSPAIDDYAYPRVDIMDCAYTVGEEYELPDGTKTKWTEDTVKQKMLEEATARFTTDHVDTPEITLDVQFLLFGDTEEYRQYKGLQNVMLYDEITIKTGKSGVTATAQVAAYEYDCIMDVYNSIKVGDVSTFYQRVPGYRVVRNSITYDKLSADLINRIRTANGSSSTNSESQGQTQEAGQVDGAGVNTKDQNGLVLKGAGNGNKVWRTDADGNPGWGADQGAAKVTGSPGSVAGQEQAFTFTDANGAKMKMKVAKLDANTNMLQIWLGPNETDRGYIKFDVSRNIT